MLADAPQVLEVLGGLLRDLLALQVVVDVGVGDAERVFVGKRGAVFL